MTAPRSLLQRKLVEWMRDVTSTFELEVVATDDHPSARNGHRVETQSAFAFRNEAARRAMAHALGAIAPREDDHLAHGHARLEARVDATGVSLLVWLGGDAWVDLAHAHAMLTHAELVEREDVLAAWDGLPEDALIEAHASLTKRARRTIELDPRGAAAMAKLAIESEVPLVIGLRVAREDAVEPGALDSWNDAARAFGQLLVAISWTPDAAAFVAARASERPSRRGKRHAAPAVARSAPVPDERPSNPNMKALIDRGAHVRALAGPFAGQAGVVQELDGKGGARVLFGLLAARVELRDLVVKGKDRGRPLLTSSHRKPTS
jgi:hypothetical protein